MATAQVIAFNESINFLNKIGVENLVKHENDLLNYGEELLRKNNSVKLFGNPRKKGAYPRVLDRKGLGLIPRRSNHLLQAS